MPITKEIEQRPWQPMGTGLAGKDFAKYRFDFLSSLGEYEEDCMYPNELNELELNQNCPKSVNAMIDYKGYDKSIDAWIIKKQYQSIKNYFHYESESDRKEWSKFIDNMAEAFIYSKIVMPDGYVFQKQRGVCSGADETTMINSRINYFYLQFGVIFQALKRKSRLHFDGMSISSRDANVHVCSEYEQKKKIVQESISQESDQSINNKPKRVTLPKILALVVYGDDSVSRTVNVNFDEFRKDLKQHFNAVAHKEKTVVKEFVKLDKENYSNEDAWVSSIDDITFCGYQVRLDKNTKIPYSYRPTEEWLLKSCMKPDPPSRSKTRSSEAYEIVQQRKTLGLTKENNNDERNKFFENPWSTARNLKSFVELGADKNDDFRVIYEKFHEKYDDEMAFYLD